jgi:hypothetical protein
MLCIVATLLQLTSKRDSYEYFMGGHMKKKDLPADLVPKSATFAIMKDN